MNENETPQVGAENENTDQNTQGAADQTPDVAALQNEIAKLRKENASHRTKNKDLEAKIASATPTLEQANARIAALEHHLNEQKLASAKLQAENVAAQIGFINPNLATAFLTADDLESGADGIAAKLTEIAKSNTYLLKSGTQSDAAANDHSRSHDDPNAWMRSMINRR